VTTPDPRTLPDVSGLRIGLLGGTGAQGRGLAYRWAASGLSVLIGSREPAKAERAARELGLDPDLADRVRGAGNADVAGTADVVVAAMPYGGHADLLRPLRTALAGRIVVDCVNPLAFDSRGPYVPAVPDGSAAEEAAALLPEARVTAAFHHLSAVLLADPDVTSLDTDVLVLGDDREATDVVRALAARLPGVRGIYAGRLRNAGQVEGLTANLIAVNRRYKSHAGIRVTDV
jgi:NADPH-dependent F420 reductase